MLAIDDLKKLAEMQALLLKRTDVDRETNLEKYKKIVIQIDEYCFSELCSDIEKFSDHNQTLEDELQFLEQIRNSWRQLDEQQFVFREVCESYEDYGLELSDLSRINVEYIDSRINTIMGYLINKKNICDNKQKIDKLNQELIVSEKNKLLLSKRLAEFEETLKKNFISAEGRLIVDGNLKFTSVLSEYKDIGLDLEYLLKNDGNDSLRVLISKTNEEINDVGEKMKIATICYNNIMNDDSKQVLDEVSLEYLKVNYKLIMLKILELIIIECNEYDSFKRKRQNLLNLIKNRYDCLLKLGVTFSIDPFNMIKVSEQIDLISSLNDNTDEINRIRSEIAEFSDLLDLLISKDNDYTLQLSNVKNLMNDDLSINNEDISSSDWNVDEYFETRIFLENQVTHIKDVPEQFNILVVRQKTSAVVRRVYEMINSRSSLIEKVDVEEIVPELVIVQSPSIVVKDEKKDSVEEYNNIDDFADIGLFDIDGFSADDTIEHVVEKNVFDNMFVEKNELNNSDLGEVNIDDNLAFEDSESLFGSDRISIDSLDEDLFATVDPFVEIPMFVDRVDDLKEKQEISIDDLITEKQVTDGDILEFSNIDKVIESKNEENNDNKNEFNIEMPDAFWTIHEDADLLKSEEDDVSLSFDDQIKMLRLDDFTSNLDTNKHSKVKKLELSNNVDMKVA